MKKYIIIIISCLASLLTSCVHDTEALFDKPAAERMAESLQAYRQLLTAQTNGWLVEYYPEKTQKYGGFNLYFRFDGESVTVRSEINPSALATSSWTMGSDMGPTINFDTHNTVLHYFSDPAMNQGGGRGLNYEGDYEFYVESGSETEFILRGKKTRNIIRMTPLPAHLSWEGYSQILNVMDQNVIAPAYKMTVGGREISIEKSIGANVFTLKTGNTTVSAPFIVTLTGIKFYEPITIGDETMQTFIYQVDSDKIVSDRNNAEISMMMIPLSKYFVDNLVFTSWYFATDNIGPGCLSAWTTAKNSLLNYQGYQFRLAFMWLGSIDVNHPAGVSIGVFDEEDQLMYVGTYVYDFEILSNDQVKFTFNQAKSNAIGNIASFFSNAVSGFTISVFNGKTFTLVPDRDLTNPKNVVRIDKLTLIDAANSNNWVKVVLEEKLWP